MIQLPYISFLKYRLYSTFTGRDSKSRTISQAILVIFLFLHFFLFFFFILYSSTNNCNLNRGKKYTRWFTL